MPDTLTAGNSVNPQAEQDAYNLVTLEQDAEESIQRLRDQANEREVALARAPVALRKMTRLQARKLGIHF